MPDSTDFGITRRLTINARALGPRVGKDVQRVIQAAKAGDWAQDADGVTAGGAALLEGEYELELEAADPEQRDRVPARRRLRRARHRT